MSEVCTPPIIKKRADGEELVTFGPEHTWRDVARWIAKNPSDLEDMFSILSELRGKP